MKATHASTGEQDQAGLYEIRLKGHLDNKWADWFDDLTITRADNGETRLRGRVVDQAALHGLLRKVRDLGLPLLAMKQVDSKQTSKPYGNTDTDHQYNKETDMNTRNLSRWAGVSAMVAGICYVVVGIFHPSNVLTSATTTQWAFVHALATAMCFFLLPGLTGIYARQAKAAGWLGLASFLLYSLSWVLTALFTFAEVFILPLLATKAPTLAEGFLGIFTSSAGDTNFGILAALWTITGLLYMLGGGLFGFATFRAGILPRWAAILLTFGSALAPVAALLPPEHQPKVALPVGFALAWLGYALWSERRELAAEGVPGWTSPQLGQRGAE